MLPRKFESACQDRLAICELQALELAPHIPRLRTHRAAHTAPRVSRVSHESAASASPPRSGSHALQASNGVWQHATPSFATAAPVPDGWGYHEWKQRTPGSEPRAKNDGRGGIERGSRRACTPALATPACRLHDTPSARIARRSSDRGCDAMMRSIRDSDRCPQGLQQRRERWRGTHSR